MKKIIVMIPILFLIFLITTPVTAKSAPDDIEVTQYEVEDNENGIIKEYPKEKIIKKINNPLRLTAEDLRIVIDPEDKYVDLYIRKKPYINSILLTNYYWEDKSEEKLRQYGLRSLHYNSVNGNEKRLYKNMFIGKKQNLYFLVDSSAEEDQYFGMAYRIRIPKYIVYGYRKGKSVYGIIRVKHGTRLNIRTFSRKYADYRGKYYDNPISLVLKRKKSIPIDDHPVITKIKEVIEGGYLAVYVQYEAKKHFFKSFLIKEDGINRELSEIGFYNKKEHKKAVLLEAYYKGNVGRIIKAVIYFKLDINAKKYFISAMDKRDTYAIGWIEVNVPASGKKLDDSSKNEDVTPRIDDDENEEFWYEEGDYK